MASSMEEIIAAVFTAHGDYELQARQLAALKERAEQNSAMLMEATRGSTNPSASLAVMISREITDRYDQALTMLFQEMQVLNQLRSSL